MLNISKTLQVKDFICPEANQCDCIHFTEAAHSHRNVNAEAIFRTVLVDYTAV